MLARQQTVDNKDVHHLIQVRTGLTPNEYQLKDVVTILRQLSPSEISQPADLISLLADSPLTHPLWQHIIQLVTVGETYFFRNQAQFDALRSHILPALIAERRQSGNQHLRLWSAGSATGEEIYSLAILLREMLPDIDAWSITLLATDINAGYLEYARRGLYRGRSFRSETPDGLRERWFAASSDGYQISHTVSSMVIFKQLNLVSDEYPSPENNTMVMDIILCRNVTIYFDRETTRLVASRFHKALNANGWLMVGHSEPQADLYTGFVARNFKNTVIYQKMTEEICPTPVHQSLSAQPLAAPRAAKPMHQSHAPAVVISPPNPAPPAPPVEDYWMLAKMAADLERWDEARAWLDKADQKDPFQPQHHYLRALLELQNGNVEQCLQLLRRSVYCDGNFALAHYLLGDLCQQEGSSKEAVRHWQLALNAVENLDSQQVVPFSDDLTVEMLVELLAGRLAHP